MLLNFGLPMERQEPIGRRLGVPAEGAIVILGAGASAPLGAPLMRGFLDRGRDFLRMNAFDDTSVDHVRHTLGLYEQLRAQLLITEEDLDNIENLLSIAELPAAIPRMRLPSVSLGAGTAVRRFIEAVLEQSVTVPPPNAALWLEGRAEPPHAMLAQYVWALQGRAAVITLNYDCTLEYACHCLGIPFTYDGAAGEGLEILKLHGSLNWAQCDNPQCNRRGDADVVAVNYYSAAGVARGQLRADLGQCEACGVRRQPLIVPPTGSKLYSHQRLQVAWSRAYERLAAAESMFAAGYSLPPADTRVRELLHMGLSSGRLRHSMVVTGGDKGAADRWRALFRPSFRDYRLQVLGRTFEETVNTALPRTLGLPEDCLGNRHRQLLPWINSPSIKPEMTERLEECARITGYVEPETGFDWNALARRVREGKPTDLNELQMRALKSAGFLWEPIGPVRPTEGSGKAA